MLQPPAAQGRCPLPSVAPPGTRFHQTLFGCVWQEWPEWLPPPGAAAIAFGGTGGQCSLKNRSSLQPRLPTAFLLDRICPGKITVGSSRPSLYPLPAHKVDPGGRWWCEVESETLSASREPSSGREAGDECADARPRCQGLQEPTEETGAVSVSVLD